MFWDGEKSNWVTRYAELPVVNGERLIFVPKFCTRFRPAITSSQFYNHYVLNFLQNELLHANDSLVQTLKSGKRVVFKKELKKRFTEDKEFLFEFSQAHPEILKKYREDAAQNSRPVRDEDLEFSRNETREIDYAKFIADLEKIPHGAANASDYHNFIFGVLQAIFYPALHNPVKEQPLNEGRKRIDISFSNGAREGFFHDLRVNYEVACPFIFFECKNYGSDPANPELDQLQGRFSDKRGEFGAIVCRKVQDKATMLKRCKDVLNANRGRIFVLDDDDIKHLLKLRSEQKRKEISAFMNQKMRELLM